MVEPSEDKHDSTPKRYLPPRSTSAIKFLCSYGGKILPRYPDGKLRYHGGETRLLAVKHSVSFAELISKMRGLCATTISVFSLRCQLPTDDLDALISITSDLDLENLIEEYSHTIAPSSSGLKIRAFLSLPNRKISPPPPSSHATNIGFSPLFRKMVMRMPKQVCSPLTLMKSAVKMSPPNYGYGYRGGRTYLVQNPISADSL